MVPDAPLEWHHLGTSGLIRICSFCFCYLCYYHGMGVETMTVREFKRLPKDEQREILSSCPDCICRRDLTLRAQGLSWAAVAIAGGIGESVDAPRVRVARFLKRYLTPEN